MKLFDRIAGALGYSKIEHRSDNGGGYKGGVTGTRGLSDWNPVGSAPNVATSRNRGVIVARSRDLFRDGLIPRGAVLKKTGKVVGTGIVYHSRIDAKALGLTEDAAEEWQETAEREFRYVADECDITAEGNFYENQYLAFLTTMQSGDVLATFPQVARPGCVYKTKIQLIEGDRVSNPDGQQDNPSLSNGVTLDEYGAVTGYWVANRHPGDTTSGPARKWSWIRAVAPMTGRRVAKLLYVRERPGQYRGMPMLAPLLEPIKKLDKFADSTLMNAIVSSMFTVFLQSENGESLPGLPGTDEDQDKDASTTERNIRLGSGAIVELPKGMEPKFAQPSNPNPNFDPFFLAYVRQMAMALETPYEVMMGAYTSSYSASRAALLDAWDTWRRMRNWLIDNFCQPFLEAWVDEAVSIGRIDAPGYFDDPAIRKAYLGSEWIGDAPGSLDPLKEADAAKLKIDNNLSTRAAEIAAMNGGSWSSTVRQLAREKRDIDEAGLIPPPQPGAATPPVPPSGDSGGDKDTAGDSTDGRDPGDDE